MEIKVVEQNKNKMVVEIAGEDHTFCNLLKDELWNDSHVKLASYNIKHPLVSSPYVIVETDGSVTPKQALANAAKRISKAADKFKTDFTKNVK